MSTWVSRPDEVDALVARWQSDHPDLLQAESRPQYRGRPVWALTVTDLSTPADKKRKLLVYKPHAHEPAPVAGQVSIICQLLTGRTLDGEPTSLDRDRILQEAWLCFLPEANPAGAAAAPVAAWDGTQYTNEEFWAWMRGVDPETGKMWKRLDLWDDTVEQPLPSRYGIVYEQISEHEYVEPNRHHRSSMMQWIETMRERYTWDRLLALHQTEFVGSVNNAMIILPCLFDQQPEALQTDERVWAEAIVAAWGGAPGGRPMAKIEPLNYTGEQRQYFINTFGDIYSNSRVITSEIQNNSLLTPPPVQQRLNEVAIEATITGMLAG